MPISLRTATRSDGRSIEYCSAPIGVGAMKSSHLTANERHVVSLYQPQTISDESKRRERLEAMVGQRNLTIPRAQGGSAEDENDAATNLRLFCWPTAVVVAPRLGFVTRIYPPEFTFSSGPAFLRGRPKHGMRFAGPRNRRLLTTEAPTELGDWRGHLAMCREIAKAVARLHTAGMAHTDLSPANVLVDPVRGACLVTDIDALVVEGVYPPDVIGTKGYIAPEVLTGHRHPRDEPGRVLPGEQADRHSLAVLIYQYLLFRHPLEGRRVFFGNPVAEQEFREYGPEALFCEHPTDASNRPDVDRYTASTALGPRLHCLILRAFVDGLHHPQLRPKAVEWVDALTDALACLRPCSKPTCWHRWFIDQGTTSCPFCEQ